MLHVDDTFMTASTKSPPFSRHRLLPNVDRSSISVNNSSNRKRKFIAQQLHQSEDSSVFRGVHLVQHMSLRGSAAPTDVLSSTGESDVGQWRSAILKEGYCVLVSQTVVLLIPTITDQSYSEVAIDIGYDPSDLLVQIVDSGTAANDSLEVAMCSVTAAGGAMISLVTVIHDALDQTATAPNGRQVASVIMTKLPLAYEDERITCVCHAGNLIIIGSSYEELYLVRRYGRSLHADRLQRNRGGVLSHLLLTGAKYMGLTHYYHLPDSRVVKLLPIPLSFHLLSVAAQTLQLWSDWSSPGAERIVWQVDLRDAIRTDLGSSVGRLIAARSVFVVDASLLAMEPGSEKASLLILSVCAPTGASSSTSTTPSQLQLWLHTFELWVSPQNNRSPVEVTRRLMITDKVVRAPSCLTDSSASTASVVEDGDASTDVSWLWSSPVKPSIHSCSAVHRVFVTWSADSVAEAAPVSSVHVMQLDPTPLSAAAMGGGGLDTRIPSRDVLDIKSVRGMDGVCAVLRDGRVLRIHAPLQRRPLRDVAASELSSDDQSSAVDPALVLALAAAVRLSYDSAQSKQDAPMPMDHSCIEGILRAVAGCSVSQVLYAVRSVSGDIMRRCPDGDFWSKPDTVGGGSQALVRYQVATRLVKEKLSAHRSLIDALRVAGLYEEESIQAVLLVDHQQLLLSAGLATAVEEAQHRAVAVGGEPLGLVEALRVVSAGLHAAGKMPSSIVEGGSSDWESRGLNGIDKFYSDAALVSSGFTAIIKVLSDSMQGGVVRRGGPDRVQQQQVQVIFHVLSLLLAAQYSCTKGLGADSAASNAICNPQVRTAMQQGVQLLISALDHHHSIDGHHIADQRVMHFNKDSDGRRLVGLCSLMLQSYSMEAPPLRLLAADWRRQYHHCKHLCSTLLLITGHSEAAFTLCCEHAYCPGLMTAWDRDPASLGPRLEDVLRRKGADEGTDDAPLLTACLHWLEDRSRLSDVLSIGLANKDLLEHFLEGRPHLSWIHHLRCKQYSSGAVAIVESAKDVLDVDRASVLLSIAKLSAHLAIQDRVGGMDESDDLFESAVDDLNSNLALIKAQSILFELMPLSRNSTAKAKSMPSCNRLTSLEIIAEVVRILRLYDPDHSCGSLLGSGDDAATDEQSFFSRAVSGLCSDDAAGLFLVALSLLSRQLDVLDGRQVVDGAAGLHHHRDCDQRRQVLLDLLVSLWAAAIAANTRLWLQLSGYSDAAAAVLSITPEEMIESRLRADTLLYRVVAGALPDALSGKIRSGLIPFEEDNTTGLAGLSGRAVAEDPRNRDSMLQLALLRSAMLSKQLDDTGCVAALHGANTMRPGVERVVKLCLGLALREGARSLRPLL